jgi:hypothetical protein
MSNPFTEETAWEVSGDILPAGNHVVWIGSVDGGDEQWSRNGYPQIEVKASNDQGEITDWIVVIQSSIGKVVALTDAAGLPRPTDEQVREAREGFRLDAGYLQQLVGRQIGVIVREEPKRDDPSKMRTEVRGWVPASRIAGGAPDAGPMAGSSINESDRIPF